MKIWAFMYAIIWVSFVQILFIVFTPLDDQLSLAVHVPVGVLVFVLAFIVSRQIGKSACPARIKRITKTTMFLAILQGVLGLVLAAAVIYNLGSTIVTAIDFLHVANALAIITQASSSSTAYDMWEEKEFQTVESATVPAPKA